MSRPQSIAKRNLPSPRLRSEADREKTFFVPFIISVGIYFLSLCVISLLISYALQKSEDPAKHIPLMSMVASMLSSLIGAAYLCRKSERSPLACGLILSLTLICLSGVISLISKNSALPWYRSLLIKLPILLSSYLGGAIGKMREKQPKRHRR